MKRAKIMLILNEDKTKTLLECGSVTVNLHKEDIVKRKTIKRPTKAYGIPKPRKDYK